MTNRILYLSSEDVSQSAVPLEACIDAVASHLVNQSEGLALTAPKLKLSVGSGSSFQARGAISKVTGLAAVKWISVGGLAGERSDRSIRGTIVLSDLRSGAPISIMDAEWITVARTAALSILAIRAFATANANTVGFIGCGLQAKAHLKSFRSALPLLSTVFAASRSQTSALDLTEEARTLGYDAEVISDLQAVVQNCDIVVTSVPASTGLKPFLKPSWIRAGAVVIALDSGRSWEPDGLHELEIIATDDREQSEYLALKEEIASRRGSFDADLPEVLSRRLQPRKRMADRVFFPFAGTGLADLAVAAEVYRRAASNNVGVNLPR